MAQGHLAAVAYGGSTGSLEGLTHLDKISWLDISYFKLNQSLINTLKTANPDMKIVIYKAMADMLQLGVNFDPVNNLAHRKLSAGVSYEEALYHDQHLLAGDSPWILWSKATPTTLVWYGSYSNSPLGDISVQSYRDRWVENVLASLDTWGHDVLYGIWVDNTLGYPPGLTSKGSALSRIPILYDDHETYRQMAVDFWADVGPRIAAQGWYIITNCGDDDETNSYASNRGDSRDAFWARIAPYVHSLNYEHWMHNAGGSAADLNHTKRDQDGYWYNNWRAESDIIASQQARTGLNGRPSQIWCMTVPNQYSTENTVKQIKQYAYGTFLLYWNGSEMSGVNCVFENYGAWGDTVDTWWDETFDIVVGTPQGSMVEIQPSLFRRYYNGAGVWVNTHVSTDYTLTSSGDTRTYYYANGNAVNWGAGIFLRAGTALILSTPDTGGGGTGGETGSYAETVIDDGARAYYRLSESALSVSTSYIAAVTADSPAVWWYMNEAAGPTLTDYSGNARHGVYATPGVTYRTPGIVQSQSPPYVPKFDGLSGYCGIASAAWANITGPLTLECWMRHDGTWTRDNETFIAKGTTTYSLKRSSASRFGSFTVYTGGGVWGYASGGPDLDDGRAHHVVGVFDPSLSQAERVRLYVDGQLADTGSGPAYIQTNSQPLRVGDDSETTGRRFKGWVEEAALYATALNATRIAAHYTAGLGNIAVDSTGGGYDASYINAPTVGQTGLLASDTADKAPTFAQSQSQWVHPPTGLILENYTGNITLEAWVRPTILVAGINNLDIIAASGSTYLTMTNVDGTNVKLGLHIFESGGVGHHTIFSDNPISINTTYHVVGVYDGTEIILYVNGSRQASSVSISPHTPSSGGGHAIGTYVDVSGFFMDGKIDEVAYYQIALTPEQVLTHYNNGITPPAATYSGTVLGDTPAAYYRLGDAGVTMADFSGNGRHGAYSGSYTQGETGVISNDPNTSTKFDGVSGKGLVSYASWQDLITTFTLECWMKTPTLFGTAYEQFFGKGDMEYQLQRAGSTRYGRFTVYSTTYNFVDDNSQKPLDDSQPHHLVGVFDGREPAGSRMKLYIDGQLTTTGTGPPSTIVRTDPLSVAHNEQITTRFFRGWVDEAALYATALNATRVLEHYNIGTQQYQAPESYPRRRRRGHGV